MTQICHKLVGLLCAVLSKLKDTMQTTKFRNWSAMDSQQTNHQNWKTF